MANEVIINVKAKDAASKTMRSVEGSTRKMGIGAGVAAAAVGTVLVKAFKDSITEAQESIKVHNQTVAVLTSTAHAAGMTSKSVEDLATAISNKTGIDDEAIQSGENLLLTFTKIQNLTGKGNDIFNQATQAITDMSVAMGQDMKTSAIQVGKALNDPIKGMTALQRVGVAFTEDQKKQIKTLVKHGHTLEAQKIILHELKKEFGGSAEAAATWSDKLKVAVGNAEEAFGKKLMPTVEKYSKKLTKWLNSDDAQAELDDLATGAANAADEIGTLFKAFQKLAKVNKKLTTGRDGDKMGGGLKEAGQTWAVWKAKALDAIDTVIGAMAKLNPTLRKPAREIHAMRVKADADLKELQHQFNKEKYEAHFQANNKDLESKYKTAKNHLDDLKKQKPTPKVNADIKAAERKLATIRSQIAAIHGKTVTITVRGIRRHIDLSTPHSFAHGGNVGRAASGGNRGNQVLVGEQGPEIVDLPVGSHVNSNADSKRMGMGGGPIILNIDLGKGIMHRLEIHDRELRRAVAMGVR